MASHLGKSRAIGERRHPVPTPSNPEPLSAEELLAFLRQHWPRLTLAEVIAMLKAHGAGAGIRFQGHRDGLRPGLRGRPLPSHRRPPSGLQQLSPGLLLMPSPPPCPPSSYTCCLLARCGWCRRPACSSPHSCSDLPRAASKNAASRSKPRFARPACGPAPTAFAESAVGVAARHHLEHARRQVRRRRRSARAGCTDPRGPCRHRSRRGAAAQGEELHADIA